VKVIYLGIDMLYPVLDSIIDQGCNVMKLFSCPTDNVTEFNTRVLKTADKYNIPYTLNKITETDLIEFKEAGCDLLVCAGYYYRVPILETLPMVNFHPSPLPLGRGPWPMPIILLNGLPYGGLTVHKMTQDIDAGDILLSETFAIKKDETLKSYMEQVFLLVPDMVCRLIRDLPALMDQAYVQGKGQYWPSPAEADWTVYPQMSVEQADRILRAFYGYECIYQAGDSRTELIGGRAVAGDNSGQSFPLNGGYIHAERIRKL
jgi:formyltransferase domain-containing protein